MHYISFKDHVNIFQPDVFLLTANETNRNKIAQQSTAHCAQCSAVVQLLMCETRISVV